jgi:hypothetical protein
MVAQWELRIADLQAMNAMHAMLASEEQHQPGWKALSTATLP